MHAKVVLVASAGAGDASMPIDFNLVRLCSTERCAALGVEIPTGVPPLIDNKEILPKADTSIVNRSLALFCVLAVAFEPEPTFKEAVFEVSNWANANEITSSFSDAENVVFEEITSEKIRDLFWGQQESLYAFGWALGWVAEIDSTDYLPDDFGNIFPDISKAELPSIFISKCRLRTLENLSRELDFYYCLHWWATEHRASPKERKRIPISTVAIKARRKSLEWILTPQLWDEVSLDT